jgi:hypothetical protein
MSCEFENELLSSAEISRLLDCLTGTQRRRLDKHIFQNYWYVVINVAKGNVKGFSEVFRRRKKGRVGAGCQKPPHQKIQIVTNSLS